MSLVTELIVPKDYGYVLLATAGTFALQIWHGLRVGGFRRAAKIGYPKYQADSAQIAAASPTEKDAMYLFNCAQRAHGNYLENHPTAALAMVVAGLRYPRTAALLGVGWMAGRIVFAIGYTDKNQQNGKGRLRGSFFWLFQAGLIGLVGWTGLEMLL